MYTRRSLYLLLSVVFATASFAQDDEWRTDHSRTGQLEQNAKEKYFRDKTRQEYRFQESTAIDDTLNGNVVVVRGDLTVNGRINGDVVVIFGDIRALNGSYIEGNVTAVDGRIYQSGQARITGNQIETKAQNLVAYDEYEYDHNYDYEDADYDTDEWDWSWSRRFYGPYSTLPLKEWEESFLVRYNRVQGLFLGWALPKSIGGKYNYFTIHGFAGYGFSDEEVRYSAGLDRWLFDQRDYRFEIGAKAYDLTDQRDEWLLSTTENSWSSFLVKKDYYDFYRRRGYQLHMSQNFTIFLKGTLAYRNDRYSSLGNKTDWALFGDDRDFRDNPPVNEGNMRSLYGELYLDTRDNRELPRKGWYGLMSVESSTKGGLNSDFSFNQYIFELRRYQPFGFRERLDTRFKVGSADGTLPLQKLYQMGGVSTLRGYRYKSFVGDRMLLANFEYNLNPRIFSTDLFFLDELNYVIFFDTGTAWFANPAEDEKWYEGFSGLKWGDLKSDIGLAFVFDNGKYRLSFAKRLDSGKEPLNFSLRIVKPF